ncbi:hypothetical protein OSTOST_17549 [Ostertagia ostertagi]
MNKMDLINMKKYRQPIEDYYRYELGINNIIWTDCKRRLSRALSNVQKTILDLLVGEPRFNRTVKTEFQIMVVGIPNVGKSSLINTWRSHNMGTKQSAVTEGARPGLRYAFKIGFVFWTNHLFTFLTLLVFFHLRPGM